jgi:hypothetical protein
MDVIRYELKGMLEYNEQAIQLKGKLTFHKDNGHVEGTIEENPGQKTYIVEGRIADVPNQKNLALDFTEISADHETTCKVYFMTKDYTKYTDGIIPIEGRYDGIRLDNIPTSILQDESLSLEQRIHIVMKSITDDDDSHTRDVAISLKYIE